jgi:hypothetical protein
MVLQESRPYLDELAKLAPQLNQATDRYMEELKTIESELSSLGTGVAMNGGIIDQSDEMEDRGDADPPPRYCYASVLRYERLSTGKWGFVILRFRLEQKNEYGEWENWTLLETTPLFQASRDMRLAAAEHVPELLKNLVEAVQKKVSAVDKAVDH